MYSSSLSDLKKSTVVDESSSRTSTRCSVPENTNQFQHLSDLSQNIPVAEKAFFEDELAEEVTWGSQHPHHVLFANEQKGGLTSTPLKPSAKIGEDNIWFPQQRRTRGYLINPALCTPRYEM